MVLHYTTCEGCHGILIATEPDQNVHPGCTARPTKLDALVAEWALSVDCGDDPSAEVLHAEIRRIEHAPPRLGAAALAYAAWGWPVFPLLPLSAAARIAERDGEGFDKVAKRPATQRGFKDATTDTARIRAWWERHPDSNIGLVTGHRFDVIDIDIRSGGMATYRAILEYEQQRFAGIPLKEEARQPGVLPDAHGRALTPGGMHFYVEPLGGGNRANMLPGIDIRGRGGYVVAPPSWLGEHPKRWCWAAKPSPRIRA